MSNKGELLVMEKKIAILTSGGDAPGMNAAIRAAAKAAMAKGMKVIWCSKRNI